VLSFLKGSRDNPSGGRWLDRLKQGLEKTRKLLGTDVTQLFRPGRALDEAFYEELETALLTADVGLTATAALLEQCARRARR
jgi:fused signal recognition particle receptor